MESSTYRMSDLMPEAIDVLDGEFDIDGHFETRRTHAAVTGDLHRADFDVESDFGDARSSLLGTDSLLVVWTTYRMRGGVAYEARIDRPFLELCFQLDGSAHLDMGPSDEEIVFRAGENNLMYVPATSGSFGMSRDCGGSVFEVLLSTQYVEDLADRYPHLFDAHLESVSREEPFWLSGEHLRIDPRMRSVIQRIRNGDAEEAAGSLFLESQILELLALQFQQMHRPVSGNGHDLSSTDAERIRHAGDVLLGRIDDPPTLTELARIVGTNEFTLKRGFKAMFGTSPYDYLLRHKLELARSYILDTDLTIAEIAYRVGYSDPAHLTTAFRKRFELRPSDLR